MQREPFTHIGYARTVFLFLFALQRVLFMRELLPISFTFVKKQEWRRNMKINLQDYYPFYKKDVIIEASEEIVRQLMVWQHEE